MQSVVATAQGYCVFLWSTTQLNDLVKFCVNRNVVLCVDTTFNIAKHFWITDTSYRNKRLVRKDSQENPTFLGPVMLHFTKDDSTFRRFALEMVNTDSAVRDLQVIGTDMEAAIYNGLKSEC